MGWQFLVVSRVLIARWLFVTCSHFSFLSISYVDIIVATFDFFLPLDEKEKVEAVNPFVIYSSEKKKTHSVGAKRERNVNQYRYHVQEIKKKKKVSINPCHETIPLQKREMLNWTGDSIPQHIHSTYISGNISLTKSNRKHFLPKERKLLHILPPNISYAWCTNRMHLTLNQRFYSFILLGKRNSQIIPQNDSIVIREEYFHLMLDLHQLDGQELLLLITKTVYKLWSGSPYRSW